LKDMAREIEFATRRPTCSAVLADGATLYSGLVVHHRFAGKTDRAESRREVYGCGPAKQSAPNPYGRNAAAVAERMFAGAKSAMDVLRSHTVFGFYSRVLDETVAARWAAELASGISAQFAKFLDSQGVPLPRALNRWCPTCAAQDAERVGLGMWRVVHQLPFLSRCVEHGTPLATHCASCSSAFDTGGDYRLPGEPCRVCGSTTPAMPVANRPALTAGEWSFLKLCRETFQYGPTELRPRFWARSVDQSARMAGSVEGLAAQIEDNLKVEWHVSSSKDIAAQVDCALPDDFVLRELRLFALPGSVVSRLIVFGALRQLWGSQLSVDDPSVTVSALHGRPRPHSKQAETTEGSIEDRAFASSVPIGVVRLLVNGATFSEAIRATKFSTYGLRQFVKALSAEQRCFLESSAKHSVRFLSDRNRRPYESEDERRSVYRAKVRFLLRTNDKLTRSQANRLQSDAVSQAGSTGTQYRDARRAARRLSHNS